MVVRFIFLAFLVFGSAVAYGQHANWQNYKDSDGNFSILLPKGPVAHQIDTVTTAVGKLAYHTHYFQNEDSTSNALYMVSHVSYPKGTVHHDSTGLLPSFFEETIQTAEQSVDGKLVYQSEMEIKGFPGKQWRINYNQGRAVLHSRALVAGSTYYCLQTAAQREHALNDDMDTFFQSFRFLRSPGE